MKYWTERIDSQSNVLYDKTKLETDKKLAQYYQSALIKTQIEMERLFDQLTSEGLATDRTIDLYRYGRFYELRNNLSDRLVQLGQREIATLEKKFVDMYNGVQKIITTEAPAEIAKSFVQPGQAEEVMKSVWLADGKHWSDRVWNNMAKLQNMVENGLIECVVTGRSKSELVKDLKAEFGVGFNQADRIVRTELSFVQNQSAADRYIAAGFQKYKILATLDARTSEICKEQNGKIYEFAKMEVGVNFPPFHPNCRTTIIPVIKG